MDNGKIMEIIKKEIEVNRLNLEAVARGSKIELDRFIRMLENEEDLDINELTNIIDYINPTIKVGSEILMLYRKNHKREGEI